jgi:cation diffusion facilitator family transporter
MEQLPLARYAWLSIAAAIATIGLKTLAYWLTGSVGLLSDALESGVNLMGALMTLAMLTIAAKPADEDHPYGHNKAEYFSSGFEGTLILLAAVSIAVAAIQRLLVPQPLEQAGVGLAVSSVATLVNLGVAVILLKAGRRRHSISLEADAQHLLSDVWTSVGVILGVGLVVLTGWLWLDPVLALAVAAHILWTGYRLVVRSVGGLMDSSLPTAQHDAVVQVLEKYRSEGIQYHALRSRRAAARQFISVHILVPGGWTVSRGHELLERIESDIRAVLPQATVDTHLEPLEEASSFADVDLDRTESATPIIVP